jgi:hypothetical protein
MNKYFYAFIFFITASAVQAQTQQGDQLLGGQLSFSIGKGTTTQLMGRVTVQQR